MKRATRIISRKAKAQPAVQQSEPTTAQLAEYGRKVFDGMKELKRERAEYEKRREAEIRAEQERASAPVTIPRARYDAALKALSGINMEAVACHELAVSLLCDPDENAWNATAIESMGQTMARRCDVIARLLGEQAMFGNFEDELDPENAIRAADRPAQSEARD